MNYWTFASLYQHRQIWLYYRLATQQCACNVVWDDFLSLDGFQTINLTGNYINEYRPWCRDHSNHRSRTLNVGEQLLYDRICLKGLYHLSEWPSSRVCFSWARSCIDRCNENDHHTLQKCKWNLRIKQQSDLFFHLEELLLFKHLPKVTFQDYS